MKEIETLFLIALVQKDEKTLNEILDESFQIIQVNGMIQNKKDFIQSILNGMMDCESFSIKDVNENIQDNKAVVLMNTELKCNFFKTGIRMWYLQLKMACMKTDSWKICKVIASSFR